MSDRSDDLWELICRALDGDEEALEGLYDEILPPIQRCIAWVLNKSSASKNRREDLEDLVQETLMHLFDRQGEALRRWDREKPIEPYLCSIAKNRANMFRRSPRSSTREPTLSDEQIPEQPSGDDPEHETVYRDLWRRIYDCVTKSFTPRDHLLFRLLEIDKLKTKTVAELLETKLNNIHQWRSRLRKKAKHCREIIMKSTDRETSRGPSEGAADE